MATAGYAGKGSPKPLWLLAELTYACPLQCPHCSNPVDFAKVKAELTTRSGGVLTEAREMAATQLGFSGGEPLVRRDLKTLIAHARALGYYTKLITSGLGMDEVRVQAFREAGLGHVQLSFQSSEKAQNDFIAGCEAFEHKLAMARAAKQSGYPMVLCFVIHRDNIDRIEHMLRLGFSHIFAP